MQIAAFTTGQIGRICKVAPRTVANWFDTGLMKGYRIPGSQDRRVPRKHLVEFMGEHDLPSEWLIDFEAETLEGNIKDVKIQDAIHEKDAQ